MWEYKLDVRLFLIQALALDTQTMVLECYKELFHKELLNSTVVKCYESTDC
jgi:hypothetical protein